MSAVSENYRELTQAELADFDSHDSAWQDPAIPERQYSRVVAMEMDRFRNGKDVLPYRVALECLRMLPPTAGPPSLLDVGASSGYYSEVFRIGGYPCRYTALDYSEHFKAAAERLYPGIDFKVGDARELPFEGGQFDIVFHGCAIIHIREYEKAIREAAWVSKRYVILHRTPVWDKPTTFFQKEAYGVPCVEVWFNKAELASIFDRVGLKVIGQIDLFTTGVDGYGHRSYVLEKCLFHHPV